jgi:hypothetical protein
MTIKMVVEFEATTEELRALAMVAGHTAPEGSKFARMTEELNGRVYFVERVRTEGEQILANIREIMEAQRDSR